MNLKRLSVPHPRKPLLLFLFATLSLGAGWGIGRTLIARKLSPSLEVPESQQEAGRENEETGEGKEEGSPSDWESHTGTITPLDPLIYMEGSHQLIDENGEMVLLLEAYDDKLEVASGMEAEVQGPVGNTVEGNQKIMTVEKIVFR